MGTDTQPIEYTVEYRATKDHGKAAALSRLPVGGDDDFDRWEEQADVNMVCNIRELSCEPTVKPQRIAQGTAKDPVLSTVQPNEYRVGGPCYALYCGPRRNGRHRWVPAVVTKVFGTRFVHVRVLPRGPT
jgi:hypothetical protein